MATTAQRRNVAPQKNRIGSQRAHWLRRWGTVSPYDREQYLMAVEFVKPETVERERKTRNFLRNIRQKETRETAEMIRLNGDLRRRRLDRKRYRLRLHDLRLSFGRRLQRGMALMARASDQFSEHLNNVGEALQDVAASMGVMGLPIACMVHDEVLVETNEKPN